MKREKYTPKPCVYVITHVPTVRYYVGKANDVRKRWYQHKRAARQPPRSTDTLISRALRRHGLDQFKFDVVEQFDTESEAYTAEKRWIRALRSTVRGQGFNITGGGEGGPSGDYQMLLLSHHLDAEHERMGVVPMRLADMVKARIHETLSWEDRKRERRLDMEPTEDKHETWRNLVDGRSTRQTRGTDVHMRDWAASLYYGVSLVDLKLAVHGPMLCEGCFLPDKPAYEGGQFCECEAS